MSLKTFNASWLNPRFPSRCLREFVLYLTTANALPVRLCHKADSLTQQRASTSLWEAERINRGPASSLPSPCDRHPGRWWLSRGSAWPTRNTARTSRREETSPRRWWARSTSRRRASPPRRWRVARRGASRRDAAAGSDPSQRNENSGSCFGLRSVKGPCSDADWLGLAFC